MATPTKDQQKVIDSQALKIAISASAGSGKTTTIINRIANIINRGYSQFDQLLVLTFTDASAQDMRQKLKKELSSLLGDRFSYVDLQAAAIGTFHSFCANIIRAWFTVAEVSPSFAVMDTIESEKLKVSLFEKIVLENYDLVKDAVDMFAASRSLDDLRKTVFHIHDFLETREDKANWLQEVALRVYEPDVEKNLAVIELIKYYHQLAQRFRELFIELNHTSPQVDFVLNVVDQILNAQTYTDFQKLTFTFDRLKKEPDFILYEQFKELRDKLKDIVRKKIEKQFKFSVAEIQNDILHDRKIVEQLIKLVEIFDEAYTTKKAEYKKLDYNDLEKYALKVLANPEAVAAIRAQYKYIFVDEGQDTNPVQFRIINILRGEDKFFCIVGDTKQSIYGFRGCEPELFDLVIHDNLVDAIRLNKNWRSKDPILHFVNGIMRRLIYGYDEGHKFELDHELDVDALKAAVKIEVTDDLALQMELAYQQIKQANRPLQDIAILAEDSRPLKALQKYLAERGIVGVIDRTSNALEEAEIVLLNHFLFAMMNPAHELSKFMVLQYFFGCTNDDLAHIRLGKISSELQQKITTCEECLTYYRQLGRQQSTYEVLTQVATEFGMLEIPVVNNFLSAIRGIGDFDTVARYLYLVEHDLVKVEINVGTNLTNAVKLMTIHHSKGLEFPMVILFNMGAQWSKKGNQREKVIMDKKMGLCVASVDTENYVQKSPVLRLGIAKYQLASELEEKKRLLYVALTRAKEKLYIVGCWRHDVCLIQPNSMLDLLNPYDMAVKRYQELEDVKLTPPTANADHDTAPQIEVCPAMQQADVLVKQSVTALAKTAEPFLDYVAPCKFAEQGGKEFGTDYHRQIQYGDLPTAVQNLVAGYTVYRELPFLYLQDQTIVQGIMDLLAVKGQEAIIVDYKTTRLPREALVAKYREQLRLYAQALPNYQITAYIYSTVHDELIKVSF
ncbi:MAG: UvrD-helicase domain-containing protein [Clostridia bacterium]|nr:UvrD-helicase domain-containing protein [Clostridia bacterium]